MTAKDKFLSTVKQYNMLSPGDSVLVAVSGGADSMCLLGLLNEFKDELGVSIAAAHVNHCIRGEEADADEAYVRSFCESHGIEVHILKADVPAKAAASGESVELCARRVRYDFFDSLHYDKTATAHTGSDRIETMFINLSRGASLHGLCSIPPVRGKIIRPLISFLRDETENYCKENGLHYVTDSTNLTDEYTRNKFRHSVIGNAKNINPAFETNALRCLDSLIAEDGFMDSEAQRLFESICDFPGKKLSVDGLVNSHPALRLRTLGKFISAFSDADYEMRHLKLIDTNLENDSFSVVLPSAEKVSIRNGELFFDNICPEKRKPQDDINVNKNEGGRFVFAGKTVCIYSSDDPAPKKNAYFIDFYKIDDIIKIRSRKEGDRLTFADRKCTKTLKKLFNEEKVPVEKRDLIPVFSDSKGVICVDGFGADASRKASKNSERILIIETESGNNVK